ncbi:MAG: T9SS type A sorting domain-containing protein [Saprospiraceae bacterium]|nr:T9SS type A sorting domain-containing protein [Saprospiraceae bacterium]
MTSAAYGTHRMSVMVMILFLLCCCSFLLQGACSCGDAGYFCDYAKSDWGRHDLSIVEVVVGERVNLQDGTWPVPALRARVLKIWGGKQSDIQEITFLGHDGVNCAAWLNYILPGDTLIVLVTDVHTETSWFYGSQPNWTGTNKMLRGCGSSFMTRRGQHLVQRHPLREIYTEKEIGQPVEFIDYERDTMTIAAFEASFEECTGLPRSYPAPKHVHLSDTVVFPNPARDVLILPRGLDRMELTSMTGHTMLMVDGDQPELHVSNLPRGLYLLHMTKGHKRRIQRIVLR